MKIKVIGSGSSGNCYLVEDGRTALLLEAGLPYREIQRGLNFKLDEVAGCLLTHSHGDHSQSADALMMQGIDLYSSPETLAELALQGHRCHRLAPRKVRNIGTLRVMPFDLHHDVRNYGYVIDSTETGERLIYITDTFYTDYTFPGVTHWMLECNHIRRLIDQNRRAGLIPFSVYKRVITSHMSLESIVKMLKANDLSRTQEIHLLHLSDGNSDEAEMRRTVEELTGCPVYIAQKQIRQEAFYHG